MFTIWSMCLHLMWCRWSLYYHCLGLWPTPIHIVRLTHAPNEGQHTFSMGDDGYGRSNKNYRHRNYSQRQLHHHLSKNTLNLSYNENTWTMQTQWPYLSILISKFNRIQMETKETKVTPLQNSLGNYSSLPMWHDLILHTPSIDSLLIQEIWASNIWEH